MIWTWFQIEMSAPNDVVRSRRTARRSYRVPIRLWRLGEWIGQSDQSHAAVVRAARRNRTDRGDGVCDSNQTNWRRGSRHRKEPGKGSGCVRAVVQVAPSFETRRRPHPQHWHARLPGCCDAGRRASARAQRTRLGHDGSGRTQREVPIAAARACRSLSIDTSRCHENSKRGWSMILACRVDKVTRICNGVDIARFKPRARSSQTQTAIVIGTITRFSDIKDPLNTLRAFARLKDRLVIVDAGAPYHGGRRSAQETRRARGSQSWDSSMTFAFPEVNST